MPKFKIETIEDAFILDLIMTIIGTWSYNET